MRISDWSSDVCSSELALFTLQEYELGSATIEAALRYEHVGITANSIGYDRDFNSLSGALGLSYQLVDGLKFSLSGSHSARAPSAEELLSDGPHAATQAYEGGDRKRTRLNSSHSCASRMPS